MKSWKKLVFFILILTVGTVLGKSDRVPSAWAHYDVGKVVVIDGAPDSRGARIFHQLIPDPEAYIKKYARRVLATLYFSPNDRNIPKIEEIRYRLRNYDGVSSKSGHPPVIQIVYSTQWIVQCYGENDIPQFDYETKGVLYHELAHAFQLEPKGIGNYGNNKTFRAMIEGVADAVRCMNGCFKKKDRPRGGHYSDGYRTTGFFLVWLTVKKDRDFLRKFNLSTQKVIPWSFDGAIKFALGRQYNVDQLWEEYMKAVGDK